MEWFGRDRWGREKQEFMQREHSRPEQAEYLKNWSAWDGDIQKLSWKQRGVFADFQDQSLPH